MESKRPKCALCSRELLFDEVERGICGCCICTEKTSDQRTIESLTTQLAALTEGNAKLKAEVAILESEVVRRDARIADMKSTPMPNDLVSREAVMAAIGKMKAIGGLARIAVKSVIAEVPAALPAAGDERWEKLRAFVVKSGAENVDCTRPDYFDATEDILAEMAAIDGVSWEQRLGRTRQSLPPQEAGDHE